jgi:TrmH family RNA methyltransferase
MGYQTHGNLGTIVRTLDAVGIENVLLSKNTVSLYSPKVVQSTMGAVYRINAYENLELSETLDVLKKQGFKIVVTDLLAESFYDEVNLLEKMVIVIGNEANGVSEEIKAKADTFIKIPMIRKNGKFKCCGCNWRNCVRSIEAEKRRLN